MNKGHKSNAAICLDGQLILVLIDSGASANLTDWNMYEYLKHI